MSQAKAFKIMSHLSQALVLEEELFETKDMEYKKTFIEDFQIEQAFLREMKMTKKDVNTPPQQNECTLGRDVLKKIHRKLAVKTHPDATGGDDEEFKKIQKAYENSDGAFLLSAALDHKIDLEVDEANIKQIMQDIHLRRETIEERKKTLRWIWGESSKDEGSRALIRSAMQIDELIFQEWLSNKDN